MQEFSYINLGLFSYVLLTDISSFDIAQLMVATYELLKMALASFWITPYVSICFPWASVAPLFTT